ncbi:uncharacterized protein LOC141619383 [Silene latifolia]|uniref:uncharacterized protein LOC141619383 n=1 Tax=Silene latifolia TaxID=37657 RepID=UPI003D7735BB
MPALLAKIPWKIITQPQSLIARTLGAKYGIQKLAADDRLISHISNASWGGRSILWGLDLIRLSCAWKLDWNENLISSYFDLETAQIIMGMPIARADMGDFVYWEDDDAGLYTVKKGYGVAQRNLWPLVSTEKDNSRLGLALEGFVKKTLWQLPGPKSCSSIETLNHLFRDCEVARRLWLGSYLGIRTDALDSLDVKIWIKNWVLYLLKLDDSNVGILSFLSTLWTIWKVRNNNSFNDPFCNIVGAIKLYEAQFNQVMNATRHNVDLGSPGFDIQHTDDFSSSIVQQLKTGNEILMYGNITDCQRHFVYVDASWSSNRHTGIGWVCTSTSRQEEHQHKSTYAQSAEQAECKAILQVLNWAIKKRFLHISIASDCLRILTQILDGKSTNHLTISLLRDISQAATNFHCISFSFISRTCNTIAHDLANRAIM